MTGVTVMDKAEPGTEVLMKIDNVHTKLQEVDPLGNCVCIAGMSGRFPGAANVEELWEVLTFSACQQNGIKHKQPPCWPAGHRGLLAVNKRLKDDDRFDADFWSITDSEASGSNPVLRHLLEVVYEAILDSGLTLNDLQSESSPTGLFLAVSAELDGLTTSQPSRGFYTPTSSEMPGVMSQLFGFQGPAMLVDSGNSSSLTALSTAVTHISCSNVHYAIVAGGHLVLNPETVLNMQCQNRGSTAGCAQADGVAAVVLVRKDIHCPRVYCQIHGAGVNSDGGSTQGSWSQTKGSVEMVHLIQDVCQRSGVQPRDIVYIEGDGHTEVNQLLDAVGGDDSEGSAVIRSSSSSVIGHCGPVSGLLSVVISILAMHHGCVPHIITITNSPSSGTATQEQLDPANSKLSPSGYSDVLEKVERSNNEERHSGQECSQADSYATLCGIVSRTQPLQDGPVLVVNRDAGGTNACVILKPYKHVNATQDCNSTTFKASTLELLLLYVRGEIGYGHVLHAINTSCSAELLYLLSHSLFVSDNLQPTRGYVLVSDARKILTSEVRSDSVEMSKLPPVTVFFGDFSAAPQLSCTLGQIPAFDNSVQASFEILDQLSGGSFRQSYEKSLSESSLDTHQQGNGASEFQDFLHILVGTAAQIALADVMMETCERRVSASGLGLGILAAAYYDGCLTHAQCLQLAYCVAVTLQKWCQTYGKSYTVLRVCLDVDRIYRLGPRVQILAIFPFNLALIGVCTDIPGLLHRVTLNISQQGGTSKVVSVGPLFNPVLKPSIREVLIHQFHRIIPHPLFWSQGSNCTPSRQKPLSVADITCSVDYLLDSLQHQVDHVNILRGLTAYPAGMVVASIPCCFDSDLSGHQWILHRGQVLHCRFLPEDILTVLGKLHMHGVKVNLSSLQRQMPHPLDCCAPPLSPLVSWDHTCSWPLPLWTEFSFRVKDEGSVYHFTLAGKRLKEHLGPAEMMGGIIYHAWVALATKLQGVCLQNTEMQPTALQLYNLRLHRMCETLPDGANLSVHPHVGRRVFAVFDFNGLWMSGNFEPVDETLFQQDQSNDDSWEDDDCDVFSPHEASMLSAESWPELLSQVLSHLWERYHCGAVRDHYRQLVPDEVVFLPKHHAQALHQGQDQKILMCMLERFTGTCKVGGLHVKLSPITHSSGDVPLAPFNTAGASLTSPEVVVLPQESKARQCVYDETTGLLHVSVQLSPTNLDDSADDEPGFANQRKSQCEELGGDGDQDESVYTESNTGGQPEGILQPGLKSELAEFSFCSWHTVDAVGETDWAPVKQEGRTDPADDLRHVSEVVVVGLAAVDAPGQETGIASAQDSEEQELIQLGSNRKWSRISLGFNVPPITVSYAELVTLLHDTTYLLYLGTDQAMGENVAGIWSPEYPDVNLCVPVPGSFEAEHLTMLPLWLMASYIIMWTGVTERDSVLVQAPISSLSITLLLLLENIHCQVYAHDDKQPWELGNVLGNQQHHPIIPEKHDGKTDQRHCNICVTWTVCNTASALDQLSTSGHLVQFGIPQADACFKVPPVYKNATITFLDPVVTLRRLFEHLSVHGELELAFLKTHDIPTGSVCQQILSLGTSASLGHGLEQLQSAQFQGCVTLKDMLVAMQSSPEWLPQHLPDIVEEDLNILVELLLSFPGPSPDLDCDDAHEEEEKEHDFCGEDFSHLFETSDCHDEFECPNRSPTTELPSYSQYFVDEDHSYALDNNYVNRSINSTAGIEELSEEESYTTDSQESDIVIPPVSHQRWGTAERQDFTSSVANKANTTYNIKGQKQYTVEQEIPVTVSQESTASKRLVVTEPHDDQVVTTLVSSTGQHVLDACATSQSNWPRENHPSRINQSEWLTDNQPAGSSQSDMPAADHEQNVISVGQSVQWPGTENAFVLQQDVPSGQKFPQAEQSSGYTDRHPSDSAACSPWFSQRRQSDSVGHSSPWLGDSRSPFTQAEDQHKPVLSRYVGNGYFEWCPSDSELQGVRYFKRFYSDTQGSDISEDPSFSQPTAGRIDGPAHKKPASADPAFLGVALESLEAMAMSTMGVGDAPSSEVSKQIDQAAVRSYVSLVIQNAVKRVEEELQKQQLEAATPFFVGSDSFRSHSENTSTPCINHIITSGCPEEKEIFRGDSADNSENMKPDLSSASNLEESDETSTEDHLPELSAQQMLDLADALNEDPSETESDVGMHDQALGMVSDLQDSIEILHVDGAGERQHAQDNGTRSSHGMFLGNPYKTHAASYFTLQCEGVKSSSTHDSLQLHTGHSVSLTSSDASSGNLDLTSSNSGSGRSSAEPPSEEPQFGADTKIQPSMDSAVMQELVLSQGDVGQIFEKHCHLTDSNHVQNSYGFQSANLQVAPSTMDSSAEPGKNEEAAYTAAAEAASDKTSCVVNLTGQTEQSSWSETEPGPSDSGEESVGGESEDSPLFQPERMTRRHKKHPWDERRKKVDDCAGDSAVPVGLRIRKPEGVAAVPGGTHKPATPQKGGKVDHHLPKSALRKKKGPSSSPGKQKQLSPRRTGTSSSDGSLLSSPSKPGHTPSNTSTSDSPRCETEIMRSVQKDLESSHLESALLSSDESLLDGQQLSGVSPREDKLKDVLQDNVPTSPVGLNVSGSPSTGLEKLLTVYSQPVLQQLAEPSSAWTSARPLYLVHPITGSLDILQDLATVLDVRCIGIRRTGEVPTTCIEDVAKYYCAAIRQQDCYGPYRLAGYSYGGLIAFEMARRFQREGRRVELLLMIDGSPHYIKAQINSARSHMPIDAHEDELQAVTEAHFLLYFISLYTTVGNKMWMRAILEQKESREERVFAAVSFTMDSRSSSSKGRSRWIDRRRSKAGPDQQGGYSMQNMADDFIRLRRQQKALDFLSAAFMADQFSVDGGQKFIGDIHLVRIKKSPEYCAMLPADYGLSGLCSGSVWIHHVSGNHESMMRSPVVQSVAAVIQSVLRGQRKAK